MMIFTFEKRIIALFLCLAMCFSAVAAVFPVSAANGETVYVLAGSDFQPSGDDYVTGLDVMGGILENAFVDSFDGILFAGDYNRDSYSETLTGIEELKEEMRSRYGSDMHEIYIQGNHDPDSMVSGGVLSPSGANDCEDYGVFVINEKDYMWRNDDEGTVKRTAAALKAYLDEKIMAQYTKPIFIVSHLPLHYCLRTYNDGDGQYANYLFDPINAAAADGLNIVFLYGHNHSNGWDDYLGGSAVYLEKGEKILIAQGSKTEYAEETLNFTYMNPGFVSYYSTNNSPFVDDLSMTVFEITDETLTVTRYGEDGVHDLKNKGLAHANGRGTETYPPDESVVASPQIIMLNKIITDGSLAGDSEEGGSEFEIDPDGKMYTRIYSADEIVNGEKYLIVLDGSSSEYLVLPESVTKNQSDPRTGYDFIECDITGQDVEFGDYAENEWVFEKRDGGLVLSDQNGQYSFIQSGSSSLPAVFSDSATVYTLSGDGLFSFHNMNDTDICWDRSSKGVITGYSKTPNTFFYVYKAATETKGWVEIVGAVPGETETFYQYTKFTGTPTGENGFLFVRNGAMTNNDSTTLKMEDVEIEDGTITLDTAQYEWNIDSNGKISTVIDGQTRYLYINNSGTFSVSTSSRNWTLTKTGDSYYISYKRGSTTYYFNGTGRSTSRVAVELYKHSGTVENVISPGVDGEYAKLCGPYNFVFDVGTSVEEVNAEILSTLSVKVNTSSSDEGAWNASPSDITLTPVESDTSKDYTMTVSYKGKELGTVAVFYRNLETPEDAVYELVTGEEGTVPSGSTQKSSTKSYIKITSGDSVSYAPITVGMLTDSEGNMIIPDVAGDFEKLTVTFDGVVLTNNFTLHVTDVIGNDYPEYPDGGSVTVDKHADASKLQTTGVVNVELSAAGIPVKIGTDVIVMVDTSNSMDTNKVLDENGNETSTTRLEAMKASLLALVDKLQQNGPDGEKMDVRIAVADFNGYYVGGANEKTSPVYLDSADRLSDSEIRDDSAAVGVYTGDGEIGLGAFVDVHSLVTTGEDNFASVIYGHSGTNYDYAFDTVYQLGEAVRTENAAKGEKRDLYVVFMSDGAPFQYNFFSAQSSGTLWNDWLQGTVDPDSDTIPDTAHGYYYNEEGKHWMAEAIKGNGIFDVIRKNDERDTDGDNFIKVQGLGATMYSIAFALKKDNRITVDSMTSVIRNIASREDLYFSVNTAAELSDAFSQIGTDIVYAATDAYFVDRMGGCFNIQLSPEIDTIDNLGEPVKVDLGSVFGKVPDIRVLSYDIYTEDQVGTTVDGVFVTAAMVGQSYGEPRVLETVSCDADKSNFKNETPIIVLNSDALEDKTADIYDDETGLISAKYFRYNANKSESVTVTLSNGTEYTLEPETFYWNIGIIDNKKITLNYYVYLEGSMEGDAPAGSYATNEYATLYYKNWLKNDSHLDTTSPSVGWKSANVSYAFYLVNEDVSPIVNQTTGATGSFYNSVKLTKPVVYQEIYLNNLDDIDAIEAKSVNVLPEGYELYDEESVYKVVILSEEGEGSWSISYDTNGTNTNYVTGYYGSNATNESHVCSRYDTEHGIDENGGYKIYDDYDYTHTTVWFAVVYRVSAVPDTVVIDYGIEVDVSVLANDMFGENGEITAIGEILPDEDGIYDPAFTETELTLEHGTATVTKDKIHYVLSNMAMPTAETFFYEVRHQSFVTDDGGVTSTVVRYYYGKVTVIPATTLYFEETFATFVDSAAKYGDMGAWKTVGEYAEGIHQQEDRPGDYNYNFHEVIDNNNIYGFDPANSEFETYSLGCAMTVTVDETTGTLVTAPKAKFTFTGTGFDLISVTDNESGVIRVTVYNDEGTLKKFFVIDNYYGYTFEDGEWTPVSGEELDFDIANKENCIYQVPVIKAAGLEYGTYDVTVEVLYFASSDHRLGEGESGGSYSFIFDSVRIYDPADPDDEEYGEIVDAYVKDGEYAPVYRMVKEAILGRDDLENISPDMEGTINGAVFIDGIDSTNNAGDYANPGPNNETYLAHGQSVSFKLYANEKPESVHLGAKLAFGTEMTLGIGTEPIVKLTSATDMYYPIDVHLTWKLNGEGVWETEDVITVSGGGKGVVSLTNVKMTSRQSASFGFGFFVDAEAVSVALTVSEKLFGAEEKFLAGDVDMNGKVNSRDIVLMRKAVLGDYYDIDIRTCDFDGNGTVSAKDILIARKIMKGTVQPFYLTYKK